MGTFVFIKHFQMRWTGRSLPNRQPSGNIARGICHRDTNLSFVTKGLPLSKISRDIVMAERDVIYRAMSAVAHSSRSEGNKTSFQPILLSGGINCNNPAANLLLT